MVCHDSHGKNRDAEEITLCGIFARFLCETTHRKQQRSTVSKSYHQTKVRRNFVMSSNGLLCNNSDSTQEVELVNILLGIHFGICNLQHTQISFIIMSNKGRLPVSGLG